MGLSSRGDFTCVDTDNTIENVEGIQKSVDDALC